MKKTIVTLSLKERYTVGIPSQATAYNPHLCDAQSTARLCQSATLPEDER